MLYAAYGENNETRIDTSSYSYDWFGNITYRESGGSKGELEGRKTLFEFNDKVHLINFSANYKTENKNDVSFNYNKNYLVRQGTDPFYDPNLKVAFETPHVLNKNTMGFNYNFKLLKNKLNTNVFGKLFHVRAKGIVEDYFELTQTLKESTYNKLGYGLATTYKFNRFLRIKTSFEHAYRAADNYEFFGNGLGIKPNVELTPEESNNYNLGLLYTNKLNDLRVDVDSNIFFRDSKDFIAPTTEGNRVKYYNRAEVTSKGVEAELKLGYKNKFKFSINATYQKLNDEGNNSQIANQPVLFGNASTGCNFNNLFNQKGSFSTTWSSHFVDEFPYLSYDLGNPNDRPTIPVQFYHSLEFLYKLNHGIYNISFLVNNITDATVYNNFSIQQPGRAYYLKLRYFINN